MSFDVSLWGSVGTAVDIGAVREWLAADDRVGQIGGDERGFEAVTDVGGAPWAAVLVEDVSDLQVEELVDPSLVPPGLSPCGIRVELSYAAPDPVAVGVFRLVRDLAGHFGWVILDDQADQPAPLEYDALVASWIETSGVARALLEQRQRRDLS